MAKSGKTEEKKKGRKEEKEKNIVDARNNVVGGGKLILCRKGYHERDGQIKGTIGLKRTTNDQGNQHTTIQSRKTSDYYSGTIKNFLGL